MSLDAIVQVTIQAGTTQPSRRGFGTPLLLPFHTRFVENVRTYSSLSGMLADGFTVNDPAYLMAAAVFSQSPRPLEIKMGRLPAPATPHTTELDTTGIVAGQTITMTVRDHLGNTTAVSEAFDTDAGTTAANLQATLDAIANIGASVLANVVTVTADTNGPMVFFEDVTIVSSLDVTADWAYDTQLAAILLDDSDFYSVCIDVNSDANIVDVAAWVDTVERIAGFGPQVQDPADYTATANPLRTGDNDRAFSLVKKTSRSAFPECAMVGEALPFDPGSQTWKFKTLSGINPDGWTASEITTLETDNSNHYTEVAGVSIVRQGEMHGGEFIDVTRGLDWLKARLQERVFALLANARKVPFTDSGVQLVVNEIRGQLLDAEARGVLDPGSSVVTFTPVANISAADKAARCLTGIEFQARLAGAVHKVIINGTVSV